MPPTSSCLSYRLVDDELAPLTHPDPSHTAYGLPVDEVGWRPRCPLATHTRVCGKPLGPLPLLAIAHGVVVERGLLREGNAGCGRGCMNIVSVSNSKVDGRLHVVGYVGGQGILGRLALNTAR